MVVDRQRSASYYFYAMIRNLKLKVFIILSRKFVEKRVNDIITHFNFPQSFQQRFEIYSRRLLKHSSTLLRLFGRQRSHRFPLSPLIEGKWHFRSGVVSSKRKTLFQALDSECM